MPLILHHGCNAIVLLEADNIARISERDPLVVDVAGLEKASGAPVHRVFLTFVTDDDRGEIVRLVREGKTMDAIKLALRGWSVRDEDGAPVYSMLERGGN